MTPTFADTVNRLARARNFDTGAYLLITSHRGDKTMDVEYKGLNNGILNGFVSMLDIYLKELDNEEAAKFREDIKTAIIEDEQRRFQNKPIGESTEEK